jgi:hypothetical protein
LGDVQQRVLRTGSGGYAISVMNQSHTAWALWPVLPWGLSVRAWVVQANGPWPSTVTAALEKLATFEP